MIAVTLLLTSISTPLTDHESLLRFVDAHKITAAPAPPVGPIVPTGGFTASITQIYNTPQGNLTGQGTMVAAAAPSKAQVLAMLMQATTSSGVQQAPSTTVTFANNSQVTLTTGPSGTSGGMDISCTKKAPSWKAAHRSLSGAPPTGWTFIGNTFVNNLLVAGWVGSFDGDDTSAVFNYVFGGDLAALTMSDKAKGVTSTVLFTDVVLGEPAASKYTLPDYLAVQCK